MLSRFKQSATTTVWFMIGIFLAAISFASAQGGAATPVERPHHLRYIAIAVVVVVIIVAIVIARGKKAPEAPAPPE